MKSGVHSAERNRWICFSITIGAGLLAMCTGAWAPAYVSRAPDGKSELRILKSPPDSEGSYPIKVEIVRNGEHKIILQDRKDWSLGLAEAYWQENNAVGLLACNRYGGRLLVSYDIQGSQILPASTFARGIENQLRAKYAIPVQAQPVEWACSHEGYEAFHGLTKGK